MKQKSKRTPQISALLMIALIITVLSNSLAPMTQAQSNSAANSPSSATPAPTPNDDALRRSCGEVIDELKAARQLLKSQDADIEKQKELAALEREISDKLKRMRDLDAEEKQDLRNALKEAQTAIAEFTKENADLKTANTELKKHQFTLWKAAKVFIVGAGLGALAVVVFGND